MNEEDGGKSERRKIERKRGFFWYSTSIYSQHVEASCDSHERKLHAVATQEAGNRWSRRNSGSVQQQQEEHQKATRPTFPLGWNAFKRIKRERGGGGGARWQQKEKTEKKERDSAGKEKTASSRQLETGAHKKATGSERRRRQQQQTCKSHLAPSNLDPVVLFTREWKKDVVGRDRAKTDFLDLLLLLLSSDKKQLSKKQTFFLSLDRDQGDKTLPAACYRIFNNTSGYTRV